MSVKRLYIYRYGTTTACALTGEKEDGRLPAPLAPERWQFWMETSDHHTEDGLYGFTLKIAETQIADRGYYIFTGSMKLLDARVGVAASRPGGARQCRLSTTSVGTTAVMSEAHHLFRSALHDPDTFNMLGEVLDEVWASISSDVVIDFRETEAACIQLATIVLDLARDGQLGQLQITRTAARLMREKHARTKQRCCPTHHATLSQLMRSGGGVRRDEVGVTRRRPRAP
jgi:hypothetical protein